MNRYRSKNPFSSWLAASQRKEKKLLLFSCTFTFVGFAFFPFPGTLTLLFYELLIVLDGAFLRLNIFIQLVSRQWVKDMKPSMFFGF